jgi:hypothetical protein
MVLTKNGTSPRRIPRWPFWAGGVVLLFLVAIAIALDIAAHRAEPFMRAQIVQALTDRFHARVELDSFHLSVGNTLKGEWGIWGEGRGLRIWPPADVEGVHVPEHDPPLQPLINLAEFHFHAPLRYKSGEPVHISQIRLKGLDIRFPPRSQMHRASEPQSTEAAKKPSDHWNVSVVVDLVDCTDANFTLETDKPNKLPLQFVIHQFRMKTVRSGAAMNFDAEVENPKPPGLIHTSGAFGPWIVADPGSSAIRGDYTFKHADLSVFKGIAGTLDSTGHYLGTLRDLAVDGETDTPDFQLTHFGHTMVLHTDFDASVDGTNGDTHLNAVNATMNGSHFTCNGQIVRVLNTGDDGRLHSIGHDIALNVDVDRARIEDFLRLSTDSPVPMLDGNVGVKAQVHIPPGKDTVLDRISIEGRFILDDAEFSSLNVQKKIRELSMRGLGKPSELKSADHEKVKSHVEGDFVLDGGVLSLPSVNYDVPGADIHLQGTYHTEGGTLDFTGTAKMQATISQMVGGWKGILLKPADHFFKKDGAGTEIPVYIAGTRDKPQFGYNSGHSGGTHPQRPDTQ